MENIEFDDLRDFYKKEVEVRTFEMYLEEIYNELSQSNIVDNPYKGIAKTTFTKYLSEMNILISEKIFSSFDVSKSGILSFSDFSEPIITLKYGTFEQVAKVIFRIYDFNSDGKVNTNDIKLVLSYLPLKSKEDNRGYKYQMESIAELNEIMKSTFGEEKKGISFQNFLGFLEKKANIFLLLLCYLYLAIPVFEKTMELYKVRMKRKYSSGSTDSNKESKQSTRESLSPIKSNKKLTMTPTSISTVSELMKRKLKNKTIPNSTVLFSKNWAKKDSKNNTSIENDTKVKNILRTTPLKKRGIEYHEDMQDMNKMDFFNNSNNVSPKEKRDGRDGSGSSEIVPISIIEIQGETPRGENNSETPRTQINKQIELNNKAQQFNDCDDLGINIVDSINEVRNSLSSQKLNQLENIYKSPHQLNKSKMNLNELHDSPTRKVSTNEDKNLFIKCSPKMKPGQLNHSPNRIGNTNEGSGSVNNSPLLVIGQDFKSPVKVSPKRSMFNSPEKNTSPLKITSPFKSPTKPEGVEKEGEEDKDKKNTQYITPKKNLIQAKGALSQLKKCEEGSPVKFFFNDKNKENNDNNDNDELIKLDNQENNKIEEKKIDQSLITENDVILTEYLDTEEEVKKSVLFEGEVITIKKKFNQSEKRNNYLVLIDKNLYYYNDKKISKNKENYSSTNYLGGSFIRLNPSETVDNELLNSFTIFFLDNSKKKFYHGDVEVVKLWIKNLRSSINYRNLFDFYNINSTIGEGQYGKVTIGSNLSTGAKVAIKIINKKKVKENEIWEMIRSEIDILKISKHPNIVNYIDNFENSDYIFIVMDYIKSGTLQDFLQSKNFNLSEEAVARIGFQLADAIKYLHTFGIIHRDLKPENVMVVDNKADDCKIEVKITDFGFGKILGSSEKAKEGYGTLGFVAPEVLLRVPYNNKIDIWSLGVIIFYMLAKDIPFRANSREETSKLICNKELVFPFKFKQLSRDLLDLIYSCLRKQPEKRITIDLVLGHVWFKSFNLTVKEKSI